MHRKNPNEILARVKQQRLASKAVARTHSCVYNLIDTYTPEEVMGKAVLTRTNLLLETGKVRQLRRALRSRSNSEAVRRVIEERLAVEEGLEALQGLRRVGGLEDVFGRTFAKRK